MKLLQAAGNIRVASLVGDTLTYFNQFNWNNKNVALGG